MKISVRISVDQRAALLAGRAMGPTVDVEVGPEDMTPEQWRVLVETLDMTVTPHVVVGNWGVGCVVDGTTDEVVRVISECMEREAGEREAARLQAEKKASDCERWIEEYESDGIVRSTRIDYGYTWERWDHAPKTGHPDYSFSYGIRYPGHDARINSVRDRNRAVIDDHNAPHEEQVRLLRAEHDDRQAADAEVVAGLKARIAAEKYARRLAAGVWEKETESYNERRYSAPWCARVTFPEGPKAVYEFGDSTGKWGKEGLMSVKCAPGDIIAWGQKDLRRPDKSDHKIAQMRPDGSMETIDKTEAYRRATTVSTV